MMQPNISEFSYGYAITEELIHWHGTTLTAAPVFPSSYQEGQQGGGYDVMLQRPGIPLFLQFKLSHCMVRSNAQESQSGLFTIPYYRMHIRPARYSDQHEMLLDLESAGNEVYYSAPAFHEPWELNEAYLNHNVRLRSVWIPPSWIGPLLDDGDHYVAFQHPGAKHLCSEPRPLEGKADFEDFTETILSELQRRGKVALQPQRLFELAEQLTVISQKRRDIPIDVYEATREEMQDRRPIEQIAFYSYMFFDTQLFIVHQRGE